MAETTDADAPALPQPVRLRGRLVGADLTGVVLRGSELDGADLDSPWLLSGDGRLLVNGIDVVPYVDAQLDRRFPGREGRRAEDLEGIRANWAAVQRTWAATVDRATGMAAGTLDARVDDEWSFAETLRHLVMATDVWLGRAVLGRDQPYHPVGKANAEFESDGHDVSVFSNPDPTWEEVLEARHDRIAMVTDHLAGLTAEQLDEPRANPWAPQYAETVRSCLHTILEEEWEHHRYAVRDLDRLDHDRTDQDRADHDEG